MKAKSRSWADYISNGSDGFYIYKKEKSVYYGPFKQKEFAEFFNFKAFGSPRECDAKDYAKCGIVFCDKSPSDIKHPSTMFASNSKFSLWFNDLYGKRLTVRLILTLAYESGAKGYKSFMKWIVDGSKINGSHIASLESNWQ